MGFILDRTLLQPGDIILTGDKSLTSIGVKISTFSRYSHAAIYVGDTTIEATLKGVFSKNVQRIIGKSETDIAVYRSKQKLSENEIEKICSYARSNVGSLYALDEAITMRIKSTLKLDKTKRQFCSRLVAESYAYIEYDFINLRNPSYCSPRQLSLCKAFDKVDGILRKATPEEIEFSQTDDPNNENLRRTFEWLNNVRNMTKTEAKLRGVDIQTINDVNDFLMLYPEYDTKVAGYMKASGYLEHYNEDTKRNPHRYNEQLFFWAMIQQNDLQKFLDFELDKEPGMFKRFTAMLDAYVNFLKQKNLEYFRLHVRLYINLLTGVYVRLNVIGASMKRTGDNESPEGINKLSALVKLNLVSAETALEELGIRNDA
ncbi:YiiX/YebB-like N1pC/P60 family cysteine hydrolase [Pseudoalteromonas sp. B137]